MVTFLQFGETSKATPNCKRIAECIMKVFKKVRTYTLPDPSELVRKEGSVEKKLRVSGRSTNAISIYLNTKYYFYLAIVTCCTIISVCYARCI